MNDSINSKIIITNYTSNSSYSLSQNSNLLMSSQSICNNGYNKFKKCNYHPCSQEEQATKHKQDRRAINLSSKLASCSSKETRFLPNSKLLLDRYLIFDALDECSFYKCIDISGKTPMLCKIMKNPCTMFLAAHFRLDGHPHVNQLIKAISLNNCTYLFFAPNEGDLHSYVRVKKRLKESEAKLFFQQMCEIVKACHEQGIILRDLKLRKFVFSNAEKTLLKLETLEDAVILDDPLNDLLQDKRGCPAYVSPEILKANTKYSGKAADIWALGVVLYTMLVGRYPFNDSDHTNLFAKIARGYYVIPECLSPKARCIIRAMLRRDSSERIKSIDVLHHPWLQNNVREHNGIGFDDQIVPQL